MPDDDETTENPAALARAELAQAKANVTVIDARDLEDGCYWPACAYHANRYRTRCVPLSAIVRELR